MSDNEKAPSHESYDATGERESDVPRELNVRFERNKTTLSTVADAMRFDLWTFDTNLGKHRVAVLCLRSHDSSVALHLGQSAADLRRLAAAGLAMAEELESKAKLN